MKRTLVTGGNGFIGQYLVDFHAVNCLGTEVVIEAVRETERFVTEEVCTAIDEMPGAYTRSKLAAEQLALKAAASGLPIVIANPTMPIGVTDSLTRRY